MEKNVTEENNRLLKIAAYASVATASILIVTKLVAWFMTGSMSILATLLDSTMDIIASLITMFAVKIAITPPDDNHHFGHGKAEQLAVLAQSAFIGGTAIMLILETLDRIFSARSTNDIIVNESAGAIVMIFSIVATLTLLSIQRYVIKKTNSAAIKSDALHYQTDLLTNVGVIVALIGSSSGYQQLDNIFAFLFGGYMLFSVRNLAWGAIQQLMDQALPENDLDEIEKRALSVDGILGIHDLKTRFSGSTPFIQMHLDLEASTPLLEAHDIGADAKQAVLEYFPTADIIVHLDPVHLND